MYIEIHDFFIMNHSIKIFEHLLNRILDLAKSIHINKIEIVFKSKKIYHVIMMKN